MLSWLPSLRRTRRPPAHVTRPAARAPAPPACIVQMERCHRSSPCRGQGRTVSGHAAGLQSSLPPPRSQRAGAAFLSDPERLSTASLSAAPIWWLPLGKGVCSLRLDPGLLGGRPGGVKAEPCWSRYPSRGRLLVRLRCPCLGSCVSDLLVAAKQLFRASSVANRQ